MGIETGGNQESLMVQAQKMAEVAHEHCLHGRFNEALGVVEKIESLYKDPDISEAEKDALINIWHETSEGVLQSFALKLRIGISIEGRF